MKSCNWTSIKLMILEFWQKQSKLGVHKLWSSLMAKTEPMCKLLKIRPCTPLSFQEIELIQLEREIHLGAPWWVDICLQARLKKHSDLEFSIAATSSVNTVPKMEFSPEKRSKKR